MRLKFSNASAYLVLVTQIYFSFHLRWHLYFIKMIYQRLWLYEYMNKSKFDLNYLKTTCDPSAPMSTYPSYYHNMHQFILQSHDVCLPKLCMYPWRCSANAWARSTRQDPSLGTWLVQVTRRTSCSLSCPTVNVWDTRRSPWLRIAGQSQTRFVTSRYAHSTRCKRHVAIGITLTQNQY